MVGAKPRRVGLVIGQLTYGGAESQLYELARGLGDKGEVVVYCLSRQGEPYASRLAEAGVPVRLLPASGHLDPARVFKLASWLERDAVTVLHAFLYIASAYAYLATRLRRRVALVTSARNCKKEAHWLRRVLMTRAFKASDAIICNSEEMKRFAVEHYGAPAQRVEVVYNGVDVDRFAGDARVASSPRPRPLTVGTVGRLERQKNLGMFLRGAKAVLERFPGARFEIVGDGSERNRLQEALVEDGLSHAVRLRGELADIPGFLSGLDQFWLTSDWEGTPNVVLEAMAAGLPVIATKVGGTPELVDDGTSGVLIGADDDGALGSAAIRLAGDEELTRRMGACAVGAARERFSLPAMVSATERVYEAVGGKL